MIVIAVIAVALFAVAAGLLASAALESRLRRTENLAGIEAYGYTSRVDPTPRATKERDARKSLDNLAASIGDVVSRKLLAGREEVIQRELVSAGFFRIGARRFLGYRVLAAVVLAIAIIWLLILGHHSLVSIVLLGAIAAVAGWVVPGFYVHRRAAERLRQIDDALPGLIDLLVVTLEAGVAFTAALRLSAERLQGPLGEEIRLTIQEQSLGLSTLEALESWLRRCDTPAVRSFVRAMVQGDRLGVSIGQILRNQATEMRARQKHTIEERAQKTPIKILFPLVFLIFPAMFLIILGPAMFQIAKSLHG